MPKGRTKKIIFKPGPLAITLLLVKFILIKIGNIPLFIFRASLIIISSVPSILFQSLSITNFKFKILNFKFLRQNSKAGRPKKFRISKRTKIAFGLSAFLSFLFLYTVFLLSAAYQLPTPTKLISSREPLTTEIYDRNGILLYRMYGDKNRTLVKLSEIPKNLIQATVAIEDRNFYQHPGIDLRAIARALYQNLRNGNQEGASTITQQLIKNSLLTPERTYSRKLKEIVLALWAERLYSKDEILQMYYNEAPFGGSIVGIAAASETYFGKSPQELSLSESSYLAGLPASPTQLSPYGTRPELAKLRQKQVLEKMVKQKYITQTQADKAFAEHLYILPLANNIHAPHFVFYIRDQLAAEFGPRIVSQGGLKIYTTLDLSLQEKVENIVKNEIDKLSALNVKNGAAMVMDSKTGQILAMVGSRDYHYPDFGNYNVTLSLRQPGSAIKPITYATAFAKGFSPASVILDTPVTFRDEWGNAYSPVNYDGVFRGPVTLRQALGSSLNIPAVKLSATIGIEPVAQTAANLGITTMENPARFGLSLTLGGAEVKMIEMMGAYGTFANSGFWQKPTGILKVTDSNNNVLEEYKNSPKQVISPAIAYLITNILSDDNARKMAFGPKSLLHIPGYEVGVKTGTSDYKKDNLTFGYTPNFVVGVWVGNPDNSPMNPRLASGITGAAPIWNKIMHTLLDGTTPLAFERPAGIIETTINGKKDLSITEVVPKAMVKVKKNEDKFVFSDPFSSYATTSAQINQPMPQGEQAGQVNPLQPNL
ncbi:PBP1A family penicillin-binding protein [Candidatus Daviesbacteria bacterium]|nr:PBP1A family penicillin-binding protein [Candidatus Daviesbacteria bacterium]